MTPSLLQLPGALGTLRDQDSLGLVRLCGRLHKRRDGVGKFLCVLLAKPEQLVAIGRRSLEVQVVEHHILQSYVGKRLPFLHAPAKREFTNLAGNDRTVAGDAIRSGIAIVDRLAAAAGRAGIDDLEGECFERHAPETLYRG